MYRIVEFDSPCHLSANSRWVRENQYRIGSTASPRSGSMWIQAIDIVFLASKPPASRPRTRLISTMAAPTTAMQPAPQITATAIRYVSAASAHTVLVSIMHFVGPVYINHFCCFQSFRSILQQLNQFTLNSPSLLKVGNQQ